MSAPPLHHPQARVGSPPGVRRASAAPVNAHVIARVSARVSARVIALVSARVSETRLGHPTATDPHEFRHPSREVLICVSTDAIAGPPHPRNLMILSHL